MSSVASLAIALLVLAAAAVVYGWAASWLMRRTSEVALIPVWAGASALVTLAFVLRLARLQHEGALPGEFAGYFPIFWHFLPLWAIAFAAESFYIVRRARRGRTEFDGGTAARSVGAFLGGALIVLVVFTLLDFRRLFLE